MQNHHMSRGTSFLVILALVTGANILLFAQGQQKEKPPADPETPIGAKWWRSEGGPDDQRGAANRLTPDKVLEAKDLITTGKVYQLGRAYESGMPIPGKRHFSRPIPGLPTGNPSGKTALVHNDELVSGEIGQVGPQFDGLGHVGVHMGGDNVFYNGFKLSEFGTGYRLVQLW